jgi:cytochrome oxidase assembly protein ShyY1
VKDLRFAIAPRWFGYLGMAIVFALACVLLSRWQFDRGEQARAEQHRIETNYVADPEPLVQLLPELDSYDESDKWSQASAVGTYLVDEQLLVRNRPYNGTAGFEVLTPLLLDNGNVFIVDRGWVPSGNEQDEPDDVPAPPSGRVEVVVRLKGGEPALPGRSAPAGQVATIQLSEIDKVIDEPIYSESYGLMVNENPGTADRPLPALTPETNEGLHLSYAIQWIVFALFGFFGLGYALRQEYRIRNEDPDAPPPTRRRPTDADIEDELVDAAAR